MPGRKYIDLTPRQLLARQHIVWGLGLSFLPPLLTSCHFGNYLCQTSWHGDASPLVTLWSLFPWMLPVAVAALGGLGMAALGAMLLAAADSADAASEQPQAAAFSICVGSLFAILLAGGLGYVLLKAISPGFDHGQAEAARIAWLSVQMFFVVLYLGGVSLTLAQLLTAPTPSLSIANFWRRT